MTENLSFKSWLVRPGNHRLLLGFRQQLKSLLKKDVAIESWRDLYDVFEECLSKSDRAAKLFEPIIKQHPPTLENGASQKQVMLYRGVYCEENTVDPANEIVYRGHRIAKSASDSDANKNKDSEKSTSDKPRFYRGVQIK